MYVYISMHMYLFIYTFLLPNHLKAGCRYCYLTPKHISTYLPKIKISYYSATVFYFFVQGPIRVYAQDYISLVSFDLY